MGATDFPAWYAAGVFGSLGCALLCAIAIACWALWRRRGVTGRVIGALLVCVVASALDMGPLLWIEYRLNIYGPTLGVGEVGVALASVALVGWAAPLAALCWYFLLALPAASTGPARPARQGVISPATLDDPARARAVLADAQPWGLLIPVEPAANPADSVPSRPIALIHALTLIGREPDNDIVLDDERVSRRHAELRWERGRVELADYGSLNGTRINQQAARGRLPLRDGDILDLGSHRYRLALQAQAAQQRTLGEDDAPEAETRKTASASGSFALGAPLLRMTLLQGANGPDQAATWPLVGPLTTIGRDPGCGITLADTSISRIHAQITRQPAGHFIADLQSSNGVYLNGARLTAPTQIFAGDIVALGDCVLRCEEVAARMPSAPVAGAPQSPSAPQPMPDNVSAQKETPSFHMRIAPEWNARRHSHPRLAPPRLAPNPRPNAD